MNFILPIGSVVSLKSKKKVMVCGYLGYANDKIQLYSACSYPNGYNDNKIYCFGPEDIDTLYFIGAQDKVSILFRKEIPEIIEKMNKDERIVDILLDLIEKSTNEDLSVLRKKIDEEINTTDYYSKSDFNIDTKEEK